MKSTELRIGNIIYDPVPQKSITVNHEIISYMHRQETGENINPFGYSPIPLTKQWLDDFDLENGTNDKLKSITKGSIQKGISGFIFYMGHNGMYVKLDHVHHLQNLYHCLTGEELKRKE